MNTIYLSHPLTMLISGPTGLGKTFWLIKLIRLRAPQPKPKKTYYFYGEYQPIFEKLTGVIFIKGLQKEYIEKIHGTPSWVILDDLMNDAAQSSEISDLFTKGSHHRNLSVILITQNFFAHGKQMRTISLNSHYIVLFKNPRDKTIARNIASQMHPNQIKTFQQIFEDATEKPHSYLFIDLKPDTSEDRRLLTNVLDERDQLFSYIL